MRLLAPGALWWLLLAAPIIFFYLLKLRRTRRVVPSTLLWQRTVEEMEANVPFRSLRRNLLMLLQLLALAAAVTALARPAITSSRIASGTVVVVIDATASMRVRDEGSGSRLERAREIASEMIEDLAEGEQMAIVEASSRAVVRSPLSSDRRSMRAALDQIVETDAAAELQDALLLAEQIAKAAQQATIVVISDGANGGSPTATQAGTKGVPVRFVRVGSRGDNAGIVELNSRRFAGAHQELFASVANFSPRPRAVGLQLRVDGKLVDARSVELKEGGERKAVVFDSLPESGGLAELQLEADDDLAADNVAYAFIQDGRVPRVGVLSDNPFVLRALAVNAGVEFRKLASVAESDQIDILVAEASGAGLSSSSKPLLAIDPPDSPGLWQRKPVAGQAGTSTERLTLESGHPVNSYLSYADLHVQESARREVAPWLKPILRDARDGLIWAGDDGKRRVVLVGFGLSASDFPLQVEFPIFLNNAISWLWGRDQFTDRAVRTGQPVVIRPQTGSTQSLTIDVPGGERVALEVREGKADFINTTRAGLYAIEAGMSFGVSLLNAAESDTAPRDSIVTPSGSVAGQPGAALRTEQPVWKWAVLALLVVLSVEWWMYVRRL